MGKSNTEHPRTDTASSEGAGWELPPEAPRDGPPSKPAERVSAEAFWDEVDRSGMSRAAHELLFRAERVLSRGSVAEFHGRFPWLPAEIACGFGWTRLLEAFCVRMVHTVPSDRLWPEGTVRVARVAVSNGALAIEVDGLEDDAPYAQEVRVGVASAAETSLLVCEACGEGADSHSVAGVPCVLCSPCTRE